MAGAGNGHAWRLLPRKVFTMTTADALAAPPTSRRPTTAACAPLALSLLLCAFACAALLVGRWLVGGRLAYPFLAWNLFLAGLPFAFALLASLLHESAAPGRVRTLTVSALLGLWLLFFPNAPYLVSDLAHLRAWSPGAPHWFDAVLFAAFLATGVAAGLASLLLVHGLVARRLGRLAGWAAIALASLLAGFGIYLGRFERFNSWDALTRPAQVLAVAIDPLRSPLSHQRTIVVTLLYAGFILLGYVAVVAMLHAGRQLLPSAPQRER
jgi:uncharacterized membrane protein